MTAPTQPSMIDLMLRSAPEPDRAEARPARVLFTRLWMCGLTAEQAANLTARLEGLEAADSGWSLVEVERLLFLRWLVESGRLAG
jgi:hypothetical protein